MYIVTNTIQTETDHSQKIIQQFTAGHTKESMEMVEGFLNFQLMHRTLPDNPEVTELVVLSRWTSKEHQKNWVKSQAFKKMHQRKEPKQDDDKNQNKRQGIISSTIAEYEVLT
ncbi:heme oxygenase (staphylobilin-producing) [Enterococcus sp. DIV0840]|uniref:antibiotic biosynthesis monooxygenase n=1 Tax=Enterococcus TaxID=1350 RepID=UPI001A8E36E3|nr:MULTISPECIES: antibiotic biosynthesis monooxygenase [Enterococcus]MBO0434492.1 antibiotic biosynthesis monooxygenase [Enterococcus sp. DIV0849a]MBO0472888.1 antibiotic biosynthesis monooxygenase [Enterococcus ureasiticus]